MHFIKVEIHYVYIGRIIINNLKKGGIILIKPVYETPKVGVCIAWFSAMALAPTMAFCGWPVIAV